MIHASPLQWDAKFREAHDFVRSIEPYRVIGIYIYGVDATTAPEIGADRRTTAAEVSVELVVIEPGFLKRTEHSILYVFPTAERARSTAAIWAEMLGGKRIYDRTVGASDHPLGAA